MKNPLGRVSDDLDNSFETDESGSLYDEELDSAHEAGEEEDDEESGKDSLNVKRPSGVGRTVRDLPALAVQEI